MKHEGWTLPGLLLSGPQSERLDAFEALLRTRAVPLGMVGSSDIDHLRERHLLDSLRAAAAIRTSDRTAVDMGSGAGLPGIPIAIAFPEMRLTLAETRRGRAAFLELAVEELGLENVSVHIGRVQALSGDSSRFDVCLARAFGPASRCWEVAQPLLARGGRLIYWAGRTFDTADAPEGVRIETLPALARSGPLVMMSRQ